MNEFNPGIVNMAVMVPPRRTIKGDKVLATFDVLVFPCRVKGCALAETRFGYSVWTNKGAVKFMEEARPAILEAALAAYREAAGTAPMGLDLPQRQR